MRAGFVLTAIALATQCLLMTAHATCPLPLSEIQRVVRGLHSKLLKPAIIDPPKPPAPVPSRSSPKLLQVEAGDRSMLLSLSAMLFCIVFTFVSSRDIKDTLIVTSCGAEAIAFLKVYGVLPAAALFMIAYNMLANQFNMDVVFNIVLIGFMSFFTMFGTLVYPQQHSTHVPPPLIWTPDTIRQHWLFAVYFVLSELWGSVGIPLLFWSAANELVPLAQARRIYPLVSFLGNTAPIFSGIILDFISSWTRSLWPQSDDTAFQVTLQLLSALNGIVGIVIFVLHRMVRMQHQHSTQQIHKHEQQQPLQKRKKAATSSAAQPVQESPSLNTSSSWQLLRRHPRLRSIAAMVLAAGTSLECTEILWKALVHRALPQRTAFLAFMGRYTLLVGVWSLLLTMLGTQVLQRLGWSAAAQLTPWTMLILALPFFKSIRSLSIPGGSLRRKELLSVYLGLALHVLGKASRYAIFEPLKELCYLPLDAHTRAHGKAAVEVLGTRLGKSLGAMLQQAVVLSTGSLVEGVWVSAGVYVWAIWVWIDAVRSLASSSPDVTDSTDQKVKTSPAKKWKLW